MEKLDFFEASAKANAAFQIASAEYLAKEANATLLLLLSGGAGSLAYGVGLFDKGVLWAAAGMAACCLYLFALAAVLVFGCLLLRDLYPPANEPGILMSPRASAWSLDEMRRAELESQQRCIEKNRQRNTLIATWLQRVRVAIPLVVLVFIAAAGAAFCL